MDSSDSITVIRLVAAVAVLSYASVLDWRTRKISNAYWIGLSAVGLVLIPAQLWADNEPLEYLLVLVPILAILSDVYWDAGDRGLMAKLAPALKYSIAIVAVALLALAWSNETYFQHLLAVPVIMLFIVVMYMLDVLRGGADAKALLALSVLFPFYPALASLGVIQAESATAEVVFPFSFIVLVTAAIVVAFFPLGFMVKNLLSREFKFPQGFLGYRMDAASIKGKHVWLMERIEGGTHRTYVRPKQDEDLDKEVQLLLAHGRKRIWVTPKIPFIIPILAALIFCVVIGNILLLPMEL